MRETAAAHRTRIGRWIAACAALAGALFAAGAAPALAASTACTFNATQDPSARPDDALNALFERYGDDNRSFDDWTGGDTTNSVRLPDGRVTWIFSDTFLGRVTAEKGRTDPAFIHNSFVLQRRDELIRTLHTGRYPKAGAVIPTGDGREVNGDPPVGTNWYWLGDGSVEGDKLRVFALKFQKYGPGGWDFRWISSAIATFSLPGMRLQNVTPTFSSNNVQYGSGILEDGEYTYVYGTEDLGNEKHMHVARTRAGDLLGTWQFWTGTEWSDKPTDSRRMMRGVANEYSVTRIGEAYVLITQDTNVPFNREIYAYVSCSPGGPWVSPTKLYTAPDYPFSNAIVYNAHAHPQFTKDGELLVTYNVNSLKFDDLMRDVRIYRPRFIRVKLPELLCVDAGEAEARTCGTPEDGPGAYPEPKRRDR